MNEAVRRTFLTPREVPGCLVGALRGDPVSLRRILGGRRSGRIGAALLAVGLLAAFPLLYLPVGLGIYLGLAALLPGWRSATPHLRFDERLRLTAWTTGPVLLAFALLRWFSPGGLVPGLIGLVLGQALVLRGLRSGLR